MITVSDIPVWPHEVLTPFAATANLVPFTRSGGRSIGGLEPVTRTDRGFWSVTLEKVSLRERVGRQTWNAIRVMLGGRAGLIAVPAWSFDSAPYPEGYEGDFRGRPILVPHSDESEHDDDAEYSQRRILVVAADDVAVGATSMRLEIVNAEANLSGVRFSYEHALYETGPVTLIDGDYWTVPIFPSVRAAIPEGAELEFDMPTCLCRLVDDRGMDAALSQPLVDSASIAFVEAAEQW